MSEAVLVVPRERLLSKVATVPVVGFQAGRVEEYLDAITACGCFVPRAEAEDDSSLKQIIPYCLIEHERDLFLMGRKRGGGERRLYDKLSLGVGGHINPIDVPRDGDLRQTVQRALEREIREELRLDSPSTQTFLGILNDDSNPVGQVHLGFVYKLTLQRRAVEVRERESLEGGFVAISSLPEVEGRMEKWSRILAESLFAGSCW